MRRLTRLAIFLLACPLPAAAQVDLSGEWGATFHEDLPHRGGMRLGDYTGIPFNEAGWRKAQSWDEAARSLPERQCIPHVVTYALRGPATIRFQKIVDPVSGELHGYHLHGSYGRPRTIWMDGRPHPSPLAPHTWAGFSTGRWERNTLVVTTTHIKAGWLQRNGAPTSDLATMTEHFTRYGDHLLLVSFVKDPVFLAEPMVRSTNYSYSPTANANAWGNCGPQQIGNELPGRARGDVPHYLPGQTAHIEEFLRDTGIPAEGARGGPDTVYPEYAARARQQAGEPPAVAARVPPPSFTPVRVAPVDQPGEIRALPVQGRVQMLAGAGSNIAVQAGDDGVLVVDTGAGAFVDRVLAAIRGLSGRPIRFVLNTSSNPDRVGGNAVLAGAGSRTGGGRPADSRGPGAMVIAHERVLFDLSAPGGGESPWPVAAWPTDVYEGETKEVFTNGEAIQLMHVPAAHTNSDSLVFFRRSDVIVTGEIVDLTGYPRIDERKGGTFSGVLAAVNQIIDLAIPEDWQEGGTMIVPARGRIADEADIVEYRDMLTIVGDRVLDMTRRGLSLQQVKDARPTFEYDARFGSSSGPWTTDQFVEAVYRDAVRRLPPAAPARPARRGAQR